MLKCLFFFYDEANLCSVLDPRSEDDPEGLSSFRCCLFLFVFRALMETREMLQFHQKCRGAAFSSVDNHNNMRHDRKEDLGENLNVQFVDLKKKTKQTDRK